MCANWQNEKNDRNSTALSQYQTQIETAALVSYIIFVFLSLVMVCSACFNAVFSVLSFFTVTILSSLFEDYHTLAQIQF